MDSLTWLQAWYAEECNGEWEHQYGIQIDTLDNPGWSVKIDLKRTRYSGIAKAIITDNHASDSDWIVCKIVDDTFEGQGDSLKLLPIVQQFRKWIENF
ncbi:MAG: immunity 53 family protein [Acidobacteriota bacterium]|nr:immunity 53 family protein [Acidobacteriota bacterium]